MFSSFTTFLITSKINPGVTNTSTCSELLVAPEKLGQKPAHVFSSPQDHHLSQPHLESNQNTDPLELMLSNTRPPDIYIYIYA